MSTLDLGILLAAGAFAIVGFRQGFLTGLLAFAGFLGGGMLGMTLAPRVVGEWDPGAGQALVAVAVVVVTAVAGQAVCTLVGDRLRRTLAWRPVRLVDAILGSALSVCAVLVVAWFLATALRQAPVPSLARSISESRVLTAVDRLMPDTSGGLFSSFQSVLDERGLPQVFSGLAREPIAPVAAPKGSVVASVGVRTAARSIVRVVGEARECSRRVEGTGFVFAPHRVLTNAHVVGGVTDPVVEVGGLGRRLAAEVVLYDPRRDLAVLAVPDLNAPALTFHQTVRRGSDAVVAGFPRGGPYRLEPARVREEIHAKGPDIYGTTTVTREVLSLRSHVEPGNSGGPLLAPDGQVYGVIFAKSRDDAVTGYALTADEVAPVLAGGRAATTRADTLGCAR